MKKYRIAFLLSHPIQYFSPLFRELKRRSELDLIVYYCSDESIKTFMDKGFSRQIKWDIPLLDGYSHKFLKNNSPKPSIFSGFFGLINLYLKKELKNDDAQVLIIHGWNYFTHIYAILVAKLMGLKVFLRGENPFSHEEYKPLWKRIVKRLILQYGIFKMIDAFLYIGSNNKQFYKYYGVPDRKLFFTPYCIENDRFYGEFTRLSDKKDEIKQSLGYSEHEIVILFVGKLIEKKRPIDLIRAYEKIRSAGTSLIMIGDGEMKNRLESYITVNNINDVHLVGFKNQTELPYYYTIADIFVLPSGIGETWGLVINEAMNFKLPVISSNLVGCSNDLVRHGENGFVYQAGNLEDLSYYLEDLIKNSKRREEFGLRSLEIIKEYSYEKAISGVIEGLNEVKL